MQTQGLETGAQGKPQCVEAWRQTESSASDELCLGCTNPGATDRHSVRSRVCSGTAADCCTRKAIVSTRMANHSASTCPRFSVIACNWDSQGITRTTSESRDVHTYGGHCGFTRSVRVRVYSGLTRPSCPETGDSLDVRLPPIHPHTRGLLGCRSDKGAGWWTAEQVDVPAVRGVPEPPTNKRPDGHIPDPIGDLDWLTCRGSTEPTARPGVPSATSPDVNVMGGTLFSTWPSVE